MCNEKFRSEFEAKLKKEKTVKPNKGLDFKWICPFPYMEIGKLYIIV